MKICGIYKIESPNNSIYIGQSVDCISRIKSYSSYNCKGQPRLYNSLKKYGFENHKIEILAQCDKDELNELEKYYVDLFQTFNSKKGLNIRDGGGNVGKISDAQKTKISISLTGKKHSIERIEKNRLAKIGKKLSEQHKNKIRENNGKHWSGKKFSDEHKEKLSKSHVGKPTFMKGKKHTLDSIIKMKEKRALQIISHSQETKNKISESLKNRKRCQK